MFGLVSGPAKGWASAEGPGAPAADALLLAVLALIERHRDLGCQWRLRLPDPLRRGVFGCRTGTAGLASALASTCRRIGGALGFAALVAVANSCSGPRPDTNGLIDGLREAGRVAAAGTLGGALTGLGLKKQPRPAPAPASTPASMPEAADAALQEPAVRTAYANGARLIRFPD